MDNYKELREKWNHCNFDYNHPLIKLHIEEWWLSQIEAREKKLIERFIKVWHEVKDKTVTEVIRNSGVLNDEEKIDLSDDAFMLHLIRSALLNTKE